MKRKITPSDVFDINKKSGALILGKNRLDDYATKFLTKYCKQALVEPMPLPVDDILKDMGLTVLDVVYFWMQMLIYMTGKQVNIYQLPSVLEQY